MRADSPILKKQACPSCGAENRVIYEWNIVLLEAPCAFCGVLIRWKRKPPGSGGELRQAFDDYEPEIAYP